MENGKIRLKSVSIKEMPVEQGGVTSKEITGRDGCSFTLAIPLERMSEITDKQIFKVKRRN